MGLGLEAFSLSLAFLRAWAYRMLGTVQGSRLKDLTHLCSFADKPGLYNICLLQIFPAVCSCGCQVWTVPHFGTSRFTAVNSHNGVERLQSHHFQ